jgi:outer membrane lipase/esterase
MIQNKRILPALIAASLGVAATIGSMPSMAAQFTGMIIFGDSLSDGGFYRRGLNLPSVIGRFTTNPGITAAEMIGQRYGFNTAPSNVAGGTNYAQGGARVAQPAPGLTPPGQPERPVSTQIREYLTANGGRADPGALYSVWAGANDVFFNLGAVQAGLVNPNDLPGIIQTAAGAMVTQIGTLKGAGARYVLAYTLPNIGVTPQFGGTPLAATVTSLAAGYNTALFTTLKGAGIEVIPVDAFTLLAEIQADFARYGFTNITGTACNLATTPNQSSLFCSPANYTTPTAANTFLFADGVHPTSAAHRIVADHAIGLIEGPANMGLLAESGLRVRDSHLRTIDKGMAMAMNGKVGGVSAFAALDGGKYDYSATPLAEGVQNDLRAYTAGVSFRASETIAVGLAVGRAEADAAFTGNIGKYDVSETALSGFFTAGLGNFYVRGKASVGDLSYDSIRRNIVLGPVTRVASSNAGGTNFSTQFDAGYNLKLGALRLSPFAGFTTQTVEINDFFEGGAGSSNLQYLKQSLTSRVSSFGVAAAADFGKLTPYVRISMDKEHNNDQRFVTANAFTFVTQTNPSYSIPTYRGDDSWGTAVVGINGQFGERLSAGIAYTSIFSRGNVKADGLTAGVSYAF